MRFPYILAIFVIAAVTFTGPLWLDTNASPALKRFGSSDGWYLAMGGICAVGFLTIATIFSVAARIADSERRD